MADVHDAGAARSPSRHATLSIESSDSFVASAAASIATGWSEPVPGRAFAAFLIAGNFLVGAVLGLAISKIAFSSRFTVGLALRAALFGGIAFLLASGLATEFSVAEVIRLVVT